MGRVRFPRRSAHPLGKHGWRQPRSRRPAGLPEARPPKPSTCHSPGEGSEAEEEGEVGAAAGADNWVLGTIRDRGSIHSDIWRGSAADLASRDAIGVFPVSGWWKEKPGLQWWERSARYSLLVSIRGPEAEIDLYRPIANQLAVEIPAG